MGLDHDKTSLPNQMGSSAQSGYRQLGVYRLIRLLGEGGMGRVFLGVHTGMNRKCAIKLLPAELSSNSTFVKRFRLEARMLAHLEHTHIVAIRNFDQSEGEFFLEMEYIEGGDLQQLIDSNGTGGLPAEDCFRILKEILRALVYAHGKDLIHRDLKPANILINRAGSIKISDFGLAQVVGEEFQRSQIEKTIARSQLAPSRGDSEDRTSMQATSFAGTLLYMSPQVIRGASPEKVDDIYAVGVIAYYMLTGRLPSVNYRAPSKLVKGLSPKWNTFVSSCLEEDTDDRFSSAKDALSYLDKINQSRKGLKLALTSLLLIPLILFSVIMFKPEWAKLMGAGAIAMQVHSYFKHSDATTANPPTADLPASPASDTASMRPATAPESSTVAEANQTDAIAASSVPSMDSPMLVEPENTTVSSTAAPLDEKNTAAGEVDSLPVEMPLATMEEPESTDEALQPEHPLAPTETDQTLKLAYADAKFTPLDLKLPGGIPMVFVPIPAGDFVMGSPYGELGRMTLGEDPRKVVIEDSFLMAKTEVTQAQYKAIMGSHPSNHRFYQDNFPVEQVVFKELTGSGGFIERFNRFLQDSGIPYTAELPDEAEWEYACRAGSKTAFYNDIQITDRGTSKGLDQIAVYDRRKRTEAVASREPNAWGLYDCLGNVSEWTSDGILRGGAYSDTAANCRAAARIRGQQYSNKPDPRFGFRLALKKL